MGTVWSDVPWTISVGIVTAGMSDRKSVAEKARTQSMVAFGLAWSASPCAHCRISLETEKVSGPAPKMVLPKPARGLNRGHGRRTPVGQPMVNRDQSAEFPGSSGSVRLPPKRLRLCIAAPIGYRRSPRSESSS